MKKLFSVLFILFMLLALTACGEDSVMLGENQKATTGKNQSTIEPATDGPHTHNYSSEVTTEATCTTKGVTTFTCSCGDSYTKEIKATGHTYSEAVTKTATCTTKGVKTFTCSCGDSYTKEIKATGHTYSEAVTKAATCTAKGVKTHTCSSCGDSYTTEIKATGHSHRETDKKAATCTTNGYIKYSCSCGDSYTEEIRAAHTWKNATCTSPKTCSKCGATEGNSLGHSISNGSCSRCGTKISVVLYEDSNVKITFKNAEKDSYYDDEVELYFFVENKTSKTLLIQADAVSLNGYSFCQLVMSDPVGAYSIGIVNLTVEEFDFNLVNINSIFSIGGQFRIIDDATWNSYDAIFTNVKLDGTGTGSKPSNFSNSNLLYSDNQCAIYFKSIRKDSYYDDEAEMYFFIENKTSKTLLIQADVITINGYGFSHLVMSDPVLPNTIGIVNLTVEEFDFSLVNINSITKLGGQLRIIDDATWKGYDAIFTNVSIR